jgi:hypothetical protein
LAHTAPNLSEQELKAALGAAMLQKLWPIIVIIAGYVISMLAVGVVSRIYLMHDIWRRVIDSATVHNLSAAHNVKAKGKLASALGEGLADSLGIDMAGF